MRRIGRALAFLALGFMAYVLLARWWQHREGACIRVSSCAACTERAHCGRDGASEQRETR